jgi:hypothetical protein
LANDCGMEQGDGKLVENLPVYKLNSMIASEDANFVHSLVLIRREDVMPD